MAVCSECGTDNPAGMVFCSQCGAALSPSQATVSDADQPKADVTRSDHLETVQDSETIQTEVFADEGQTAAMSTKSISESATMGDHTSESSASDSNDELQSGETTPLKSIEVDENEMPETLIRNPLDGLPLPYERGVESPLRRLSEGRDVGDKRWWLEPTVEASKPEPETGPEAMASSGESVSKGRKFNQSGIVETSAMDDDHEESRPPTGLIVIAVLVVAALAALAFL